jgi:hypothetical protein
LGIFPLTTDYLAREFTRSKPNRATLGLDQAVYNPKRTDNITKVSNQLVDKDVEKLTFKDIPTICRAIAREYSLGACFKRRE